MLALLGVFGWWPAGDWLYSAGVRASRVGQSLEGMAVPSRQKGFKASKCLFPFPQRRPASDTPVILGRVAEFENPVDSVPAAGANAHPDVLPLAGEDVLAVSLGGLHPLADDLFG